MYIAKLMLCYYSQNDIKIASVGYMYNSMVQKRHWTYRYW